MLQWKLLGTLAFFPTIFMAGYICYKTFRNSMAFRVNLAVFCWISANSCWMFEEFYLFPVRPLALVFFALGLVLIFSYLYQILVRNKQEDEIS